jgi:hypothetical protein
MVSARSDNRVVDLRLQLLLNVPEQVLGLEASPGFPNELIIARRDYRILMP